MCSSTLKLSTICHSTSSQLSGEDYNNAISLAYTAATCSVVVVRVCSSSSLALSSSAVIFLFETVKKYC